LAHQNDKKTPKNINSKQIKKIQIFSKTLLKRIDGIKKTFGLFGILC